MDLLFLKIIFNEPLFSELNIFSVQFFTNIEIKSSNVITFFGVDIISAIVCKNVLLDCFTPFLK